MTRCRYCEKLVEAVNCINCIAFCEERCLEDYVIAQIFQAKQTIREEKNKQDQDFDDEEDFQKWKKEYVDKLTEEKK